VCGKIIVRQEAGPMHRLIEEQRPALTEICARYGVLRLEVFGSATTDRFDPESSDLDFLLELEPSSPRESAERYFGLLEDLEALFHRPVDLVMTRAIKNPYFLQGIERNRTLLYAA
jgi:predicted nucleotidyltransferase